MFTAFLHKINKDSRRKLISGIPVYRRVVGCWPFCLRNGSEHQIIARSFVRFKFIRLSSYCVEVVCIPTLSISHSYKRHEFLHKSLNRVYYVLGA